jgi:hypothetical protein
MVHSAGFAGAFIDREVEKHGVSHSYNMTDKPDLAPPIKTGQFHRQREGETSWWASIAVIKTKRITLTSLCCVAKQHAEQYGDY